MGLHGIAYNLEALGAWTQPWQTGTRQILFQVADGVALQMPGAHIRAVVVN